MPIASSLRWQGQQDVKLTLTCLVLKHILAAQVTMLVREVSREKLEKVQIKDGRRARESWEVGKILSNLAIK